ncbi:GTPase-associated system all-helical protein GASH [Flavobacterium sp. CSZ]|uniref:GTPase-associated system all-helical protein GASH n=1 Tax=Flavobacterium sp. CSZ TaxID=2783791 RepID=UPI00188ABA48|nr:GTPase-associated system all-helical protein GASH [Flavobacterium sp. CSZ]MBF4487553.1 hypothetical protein [Flavobacterium sp. CSZ]
MIQEYLNSNLLSVINDEDFKKLKKAADEIAKKLVKSKIKIVSYTLTAINPDISADDVNIIEVKEIIIKNWSTFLSNTKDTPLTYIKAVMLEALNSSSEDSNNSLLIWFASRNIVKYFKLIGEEKRIILDFISKLGNTINQTANKEWALSSGKELVKKTIDLKDITKYLPNEESLTKYLEDAVGPTNKAGKANFDSPNPYLPDEAAEWTYEFPSRTAKGIKIIIDGCLRAIVSITNENKDKIQSVLNEELEVIKKEIFDKNKSSEIRSELLWWKEAGYSTSADISYRELDQSVLEIILAKDYSYLIPVVYPKAVDYFLKGTYKELKVITEQKMTIEDFLTAIQKHSETLKTILPEQELLTGKTNLLYFINGLLWNKLQLTQFEKVVGIELSTKLFPTELVNWLFHDFQLIKITNTK